MATVTVDEICLTLSEYFDDWVQGIVSRNEPLQWCLADMTDITDSSLLTEKKQYIYAFILEAIKTIKGTVKDVIPDDDFVYDITKNRVELVIFIASLSIDEFETRMIGDSLFINASVRATLGGRKRLYFDYKLSIIPDDTESYNIDVSIENVSRETRK